MIAALCVCASICLAQSGIWIDVPFVKQPAEGCGAASIAMVMQYWQAHQGGPQSRSADVSNIQRALYSEKARGIYASDLQRYLNQQGFQTYVLRGDAALLAHHLQRGRPMIVALQPASNSLLHYVVVTGIEPDQHTYRVNDPAQRKLLKVDTRNFEQEWRATGNWTLLALPNSGQ
jgi:ABC-type bacteriocin/lantibiotic exporter with double-glycine peptidase domain